MIGKDVAAGLVLTGLGAWVNRQGRLLSYRDEFGPGPGFLPYWLGVVLAVLALFLIISAVRGRLQSANTESSAGAVYDRPVRTSRALLAVAGMAVIVAAMELLGFFTSFALLTFFLVYGIERRPLARAITAAAALALAFFILFRILLPIPLPAGAWGG
jgi:hypothetical protein